MGHAHIQEEGSWRKKTAAWGMNADQKTIAERNKTRTTKVLNAEIVRIGDT
jgi:hypothetical protein